ncbi:hypothetical protein [Streptomyces sp. NPDC001714]|uniref:hypothetical protein n=1 Tax=Streptomyces sp. NPDC001714 TaxID=3364603 RepID=UPI0036B9CEE5
MRVGKAAVRRAGARAGPLADDRPFGFPAPHRHARLVLAAARVTDPLPCPEYPWKDDE